MWGIGRPAQKLKRRCRRVKRRGRPAAYAQQRYRRPKGAGNAFLFNGPQLGYSIPELFVEFELHSPAQNIRGVSAAGVPVMGIGHNGRLAWGFTSGLSDEDDLYAESLTGQETYRFKGQTRRMECRDERFDFRAPATDLPDLMTSPSRLSGSTHRADLPHGPRPGPGARERRGLRAQVRDLGPRAGDARSGSAA